MGDPRVIVTGVNMDSLFGQIHAAVSDNGLIAFANGGDRAIGKLAWVDRVGRTEFLSAADHIYGVLDLSPDGKRLAVHVADASDYIWWYDLDRREGRRLTTEENSGWPIWSHDNNTVAYGARNGSQGQVLTRGVNGGPAQVFWSSATGFPNPSSWSTNSQEMAIDDWGNGMFFMTRGTKEPAIRLGNAGQWGAQFSPDGKWIAHTSNESGRYEIFVRSYPDFTVVRQISTDGGAEPLWCTCGELFYRNGDRWMSTVIRTTPELQWQPPQLAFQTSFVDTPGRSYDVSPDGKRLFVVKRVETDVRSKIGVLANWTELMTRAPASR